MKLSMALEPLFILSTLQSHGYEAYLVGGAVRDLIMYTLKEQAGEKLPPLEQTVTDYDFTTNATPEQILAIFPESFYENQFGTVSIAPKHLREMLHLEHPPGEVTNPSQITKNRVIDVAQATKIHQSLAIPNLQPDPSDPAKQEHNYEITTYRSEGTYQDHRRPTEVKWGATIEDDLSRRDFTINAMAIQISQPVLTTILENADPNQTLFVLETKNYRLIDLYSGMKDLAEGLIKTVGDPAVRFEEDALRMLRAIRFSVQLQMKMTDEIFTAISSLATDIQHVSWERIRDEFLKMIASPQPAFAIELLEETGLLHFILPELLESKGVEQAGHHTTDVWTHSLDALDACPSPDPIVRFATLMHDIAKPRTFRLEENKITFYNHEIVGSRMAKSIAQRFRLSKKDSDRIFMLVRYHMFYYQPQNTDAAIRRFMRKVGLENIDDILDLREADRLGSGARKTSWRLEEMKQRMIDQLHQPFSITDMEIDGTDLMTHFQVKPGPVIGRVLKTLFEQVMDHPELNTKETLLQKAKEILDTEETEK
jgi:tRNA nucleotidyltransferase (CCA-adding enzyme)